MTSRVAVVHLAHDAVPEELFSCNSACPSERAENLAKVWALEDGTSAWRIISTDGGGAVAVPIGVAARVIRQ